MVQTKKMLFHLALLINFNLVISYRLPKDSQHAPLERTRRMSKREDIVMFDKPRTISEVLTDEKVKYVRNNKLSNTRSDVPDEDTDLLVVPDESSPLTSIAETAKRRIDLDKASSNVLSESSSGIEGQFNVYSYGSTSNDQWTGTAKGEPAIEKVADEKPIEGTSLGIDSDPRKLADERIPEEQKQDEKTSIEKATEEQPDNGLARNRFDSTVGQNYATDVSKHLSELLKNGSTNLDVTGEQKDVEGLLMEASDANQPKEQLPINPSGQAAMPGTSLSKQTERQLSEDSAASPQVLESSVNSFDALFGQDDSLQSSEQASSPVINQPKVANSEQEQSSPIQPPVSSDQLSTSKDVQSINNPSVTGTAAGEAAIGSAAQTYGLSEFGSEPSGNISDKQQARVGSNPVSEQEALLSPTTKLPPTPNLPPTPKLPSTAKLPPTPQSPTPQTPQPPFPPQLSSSTPPPPPTPPPLPPLPPSQPSTQKPPVDIDDLFGKHIVQKADETQDEGSSGSKNSTIMLVQTGNETQYNSLKFSKNNTDSSRLNYITPESSIVGNELENNQGLGSPYASQVTYMDERLNSYGGKNAGIQISEQPASVRHLTSFKPIQDSDEYSLKLTKQQSISRGSANASYVNDTAMGSNASHVQNKVMDNATEPFIEREGSAFVSALNSSEVTSNGANTQQASLYSESSSDEEADADTLKSPKSSFYKMEYTKVAYSAGVLLSSLKSNAVSYSDMNALGNETNQMNDSYQSLAGLTSTESLQEQSATNSSIHPSTSSNNTLSLTAESNADSENLIYSKAGNEYNLWKNETKEENIRNSLYSLNATESGNNSISSIENKTNDETPLYAGYFEKGLSSNPLQILNASFGSTLQNSMPAPSNYSSISLHDSNATLSANNYSSTPLQQMYSSSYINYTMSRYTSSGNFTQSDMSGSNCSTLSCNQSSSLDVTPSSNYVQPQFYNFSTISNEQMAAIQNAAVSKEPSFSSNISVDTPSYIYQTKAFATSDMNNAKVSHNDTYVADSGPTLYNNTNVLSNIVPTNYSSFSYNGGFLSPSGNNTKPQFFNYDNITLNQMKNIQDAAVSTEALSDLNGSAVNGTSFSTSFLSQYLSQVPELNASLSYSVLANKGRPQVFDFNTNQSVNRYFYNTSGLATRNNVSISNYGQLYDIAYNYSKSLNTSTLGYWEQNFTRQSEVENGTYLAAPAPSSSVYNYTQPLNQSVPLNGQSSIGNNYWSSQSVPSNGKSSMGNKYWSNQSVPSNATTAETYPFIPYVSEVLKALNYSNIVSLNSTNLLYAAQTTWEHGNADIANTSKKINSRAGNLSSSNLTYLFPTTNAATGTAATVMSLANNTVEKVAETNRVQQAKNFTLGVNKATNAQPLNGTQANVVGRLVVGHFRQQDIKIAVEQLIVQKPEGPTTTTAPLSQSPILSAIDQLSNGTSDQFDVGKKHAASAYQQNNMASPSIAILSASISYSKAKEGAKKNGSDETLSQDKLPFKNEEPIITSQLVNPADSTGKAAAKKPSLTAIISGGKKKPNSDSPYPNCDYDRMIASQPTSFDMVVPECDTDGAYKAIQCYEHKTYGKWCWCVDKLGLEIIGTRAANEFLTEKHCVEARKGSNSSYFWTTFYQNPTRTPRPPHSTRKRPALLAKALPPCLKEKQQSLSPLTRDDTFIPECNPDGSYRSRQCFTHMYYGKQCWCVDQTGQEILGTRKIDGSHPDCKKVEEDLCTYKPQSGKCNLNITKFYFNTVTKECEIFVYSGCDGNANNFMTILECETRCKQGYGVILQVNDSKESLINQMFDSPVRAPSQNEMPAVVSKMPEMTSNGSGTSPEVHISKEFQNYLNEASKYNSTQKEIPQQTSFQKVESIENEKKPSSIIIMPYESSPIAVPFKQEKPKETLPILNSSYLEKLSVNERVPVDNADIKRNNSVVDVKSDAVITGYQEENGTFTQDTMKIALNQTVDSVSDIYITVAFDIFMGWNPRMVDPTFPPRLNVLKLLNEAFMEVFYAFEQYDSASIHLSPMLPENPEQAHFIHVVAKFNFVAAIDDPLPTLNETIQRGMLGKIPVLKGSLALLNSQGISQPTAPPPFVDYNKTHGSIGEVSYPGLIIGGCAGTRYGCCLDGKRAAEGPDSQGCPEANCPCTSITVEIGIVKAWSDRLNENDTQDYIKLWTGINNWMMNSVYIGENIFASTELIELRPRKEPEHVQQSHYTNVLMKINFAQPMIDPITRLAEAVQNSSNIDVFPVADSLSVIDASGVDNSGGAIDYEAKEVYPPYRYVSRIAGKKLVPVFSGDHVIALVPAGSYLRQNNTARAYRRGIVPIPPANMEQLRRQTVFNPPSKKHIAVHLEFDQYQGDLMLDTSGHENNAMATGAATRMIANYSCGMAERLIGGQVSFNGTSFAPKPTIAATIAVWIKLRSSKGRQSIFYTVGKGQYNLAAEDGRIVWSHMDDNQKVIFKLITLYQHLKPNKWAHIAGTYDSVEGKAKLYVNSRFVHSVAGSGALSQDWSKAAVIGDETGVMELDGIVDEFYIYTKALSHPEIVNLAQACAYGVPSPRWGLKKPCKSCRIAPSTKAPTAKTAATNMTKATSKFTTLSPTVAHTTQPQTTAHSTTQAPGTASTTPATLFTTAIAETTTQAYEESTPSATSVTTTISSLGTTKPSIQTTVSTGQPITNFSSTLTPTSTTANKTVPVTVVSSTPAKVTTTSIEETTVIPETTAVTTTVTTTSTNATIQTTVSTEEPFITSNRTKTTVKVSTTSAPTATKEGSTDGSITATTQNLTTATTQSSKTTMSLTSPTTVSPFRTTYATTEASTRSQKTTAAPTTKQIASTAGTTTQGKSTSPNATQPKSTSPTTTQAKSTLPATTQTASTRAQASSKAPTTTPTTVTTTVKTLGTTVPPITTASISEAEINATTAPKEEPTDIPSIPPNAPAPIRTCREFYDRCSRRRSGIYQLQTTEDENPFKTFCDMTYNGGGWTLILTSKTSDGWTNENILNRSSDFPALNQDFSILGKADRMKSIVNGEFEIRLEGGSSQQYGGIWRLPSTYSFVSTHSNQTDITLVNKFSQWSYVSSSLKERMPYLTLKDAGTLLTTSANTSMNQYGTIVSRNSTHSPALWIEDVAEKPHVIWYWLREPKGVMNVSTSHLVINIFYYNVEVISNETQIILEWTIGSERKMQLIQVNSIMRVRNELKTSVPQPPGVIFRAYSFDDKSQLLINNDDTDTEVMPSTSRDEFTVLVVTRTKDNETAMETKKYTFNYQIVNKVGVDLVISYSEFGWKEEINLSPEEILDWYRVFQAIKEPVFTIRASIKGGGMNFLIAGQIEYTLKPMSEENSIIVLPVTAEKSGALQVPQQYFVNADITNRAGRRVSLVWRDDIIELDIADGATVQFRYKVLTYLTPPPVYKLFVVRYGTNVSDLINKDSYLAVPAVSAPTNVTSAICSSSAAIGSEIDSFREEPICPPAVDGDYSSWSAWSYCSVTCGDGYQTRSRQCNSPSPENGGKTCIEQGFGSSSEMQICKLSNCPDKTPLKYYLRLRVINYAGGLANIYYSDGIESNNERIGNEMIEEIRPKLDFVDGLPANYTVTATNLADNSPLYINGRDQMVVYPSRRKIDYNLYLSASKDENNGEMKEFYIDVLFINNASGNVTLLYEEFNVVRDRTVLLGDPYRMKAILRTTVSPSYNISAVKIYSRDQYFLNGQQVYQFQPSIGKPGPMHMVYVTDGPSDASTIPRTYYMNLEVINQAGIAISVNYKDGKESIDLPAGGVGHIKYSVLSIVPPDSIVYRVHESESGEMLLLNGKSELSITPRLSSESKYKIIITKEGSPVTPKMFYLSLTLINVGKELALVNWIEHSGRKVYIDVFPNSQKIAESAFTSATKPDPILITAVGKETNVPLMLNSQKVVRVTPTERKQMVTIKIGNEESLKAYYLHLKFVNHGSKVVVASWLDPNGKLKSVEVNPGFVEDRSVFTATYAPADIEITAKNKETNNPVLLNDTQSLQISPKESNEFVTIYVREDTTKAPGKVYYLIMRAKNIGKHAVDATINYTGPQGPEDLDVLAGQIVTKEIIFTTSTQPAPVEIKAYDRANNSLILINGRQSIFANLTLTKIVTDIDISDAGIDHQYTYYFSINATNAASRDAELRWQGVSGDEQLVVWRNGTSEKESVVIGSTIPQPFLITAYGKGTSTSLLINGMESLSLPLSLDKETTYLTITDATVPQLKKHYIVLSIVNKSPNDVTLSYLKSGQIMEQDIKGNTSIRINLTITSSKQPEDVGFKVFHKDTNSPMLINGSDILMIRPMENATTTSVVVDDGQQQEKTYYISLSISNQLQEDIAISFLEDGRVKEEAIPKVSVGSITMAIASYGQPNEVEFRAFMKGTTDTVLMNGADHLRVAPTESLVTIPVVIGNGGDSLKTYYFSINVTNDVSNDAEVKWKGISGNEELIVWKDSVMMKEMAFTSAYQPQNFTLRAFERGTENLLLLNNSEYIDVPLSLSKHTINIKITKAGITRASLNAVPGKLYAKLHVGNHAGKKVTLVWSEDDSPKTRDIVDGESVDILKTVDFSKKKDGTLPSYEIQVREFDTGNNLMINGQKTYTVTTTEDPKNTKYIEITPGDTPNQIKQAALPDKSLGVVTYVVVLFDNQLDRTIKIVPSRSSHGKYFVEPRGFLLANITIDSHDPFEEIAFKAYDQDRSTQVLLNNSLNMALMPSEDPNIVHKLTVTPQALKVIPSHSYALLEIHDNLILGNPNLKAHGPIETVSGGGLKLNGESTWIDGHFKSTDCLIDPGLCEDGFSIAGKFMFQESAKSYTDARYVLDTGAHGGTSRGVSVYLKNGKLHFQLTTSSKTWTTDTGLLPLEWVYIIATWKADLGLLVYFNAVLKATDPSGTAIAGSQVIEANPNFSIGRNVRGPSFYYSEFFTSSFTTFYKFIPESEIVNVYLFFWSSYTAKAYSAILRVNNDAGRTAKLIPDKGHAEGFIVQSGKPLEITLVDLSTDGRSVAPVYFNASDAETGLSLLINNNNQPVPITPSESQADYTDLVITVPAPGVSPAYIWPLTTIKNGQVPTTPPLKTHGNIIVSNEGLIFEDESAYLNAGDFQGQCFANPLLCENGFSVGLKVKFDDTSKEMNQPRYVIDTGGQNGQGFSIYLQNNKLYSQVAYNNKMWRVETNINFNDWIFVMFAWNADTGLTLYLNGGERGLVAEPIQTQGHTAEKSSNLVIGHSNILYPSKRANVISPKLYLSICTLFESYIDKFEATKIFVYYWGHTTTISSDRYINVNFENKAGVDVTLYPDKGEHRAKGYPVKPSMTLELRLVEQGSQTNFPVLFSAKNSHTGEKLLIEGETTYVATPTETSDPVLDAVITATLSCPEENGVFADPADRFGFISCNGGIAQKKQCPSNTIWNDEAKECSKEKLGSDSGDETKYAKVSFSNLAGATVVITAETNIPMANKEVDLYPGSQASLEIQSSINEPVVFSAKDKDTNAMIELNGEKSFKVQPIGDPAYNVSVLLNSADSKHYNITTLTGTGDTAGTNSKVFIKLFGSLGESEEIQLSGQGQDVFRPGERDVFQVTTGSLGELQKIQIRSDDTGDSPDWFIEKVTVTDQLGQAFDFPATVWLSSDPGKNLIVTLRKGLGAVDSSGGTASAPTWKTANIELSNTLFKTVKLNVSTQTKSFTVLPEADNFKLKISSTSNEARITAEDADNPGTVFLVNGQKVFTVGLSVVGSNVKITITDMKDDNGKTSMPSHRKNLSLPKPTSSAVESKTKLGEQQVVSPPLHSSSVKTTSGTKASSNMTGITRTTGKTGPTIMFPLLNMAEQDITVRETSGTNQTIDILNKEKGLVAMTLSYDRPPLRYVAVAKTGNDSLMISGQREYTLDLKKLGKDGSFPGLYVHKDGQDWKTLVNGQDSNKKTFHFAATDISGEKAVTLVESAITKLRFDIVKGSIIQSGVSSFGISAPFQLSASTGNKAVPLLINGQDTFYANGSRDSSDVVNLVIHRIGQNWTSETSNGNLALSDSMISQFIIMNMLQKDITVEELSSDQRVDIQQSEMMQLARPPSNKKEGFTFSAIAKDTKKAVMINGQMIFPTDINDLSLMNILVVHDEGQNWQQIQSSLLQTGGGGAETSNEEKLSEDAGYPSLPKPAEPAASKYNLQITAVNMLPNETVVLQEVTDEKESVDIPGNATATLGLLISGATRPLRFKAIVKSSNEIMCINDKKEFLVDPMSAKGLESIMVIARKGAAWEETRSATLDLVGAENQGLVQIDDAATYDLENEAKSLQLKVVNKDASNIRIQEISSAGQRLDVPADATATLGFLIRARQEPLKFKAFETKSGSELLLNGQRILPIDVDSKGYAAIIVVHKQGLNFEVARNEEFQRTKSAAVVATSNKIQSEAGAKADSLATKVNPLHSSGTTSKKASNATSNVWSYFKGKVSNEFSGSGSNLPVHFQDDQKHKAQSELRVPSHEIGAAKQQLLPDRIDFVIANGADGFVYLDETTGTGQRIELPRKYSLAKLSIKAKSRFMPLTFKATMKDSSTQVLVNGKESLDVASEALSPYWLVIHHKGEDWEAIKSAMKTSQGIKVDLSAPGVTKLIANSAPSNLKMIPIAFRNIVGKDAELIEVTGTNYKTSANANSAGLFALPVTPMGRTQPVKLNARVRNGSTELLMNGEKEYSIDLDSAYMVIIIHAPEQRWRSARKNFHNITLGNYTEINMISRLGENTAGLSKPVIAENNGNNNDTDFVGGSGQAAFDASKTAIYNSAGIVVELLLNGNHLKDLPAGARGTVTLTTTKGVLSKLTAVAVGNRGQLLLNNEKELEFSSGNYPNRITISAQNTSDIAEFMNAGKGDMLSLKYGKVNFINLANKEVKIFEVSGIGEPTLLSPNFISTFFLKSPKDSAIFKAEDPVTSEVYWLNEQPSLKVKLDENPRVETEVQVTAPKYSKQLPAKKAATCLAVTELGPCYSALQYETQVEAAEGKSESCKKYLEEVLSKCPQKNFSYGIDSCKQLCNSKDSDVCERIWSPKICSSSIVRYSFNPETQACQAMNFNGCLGNENNFATPEDCARACLPEIEAKKPKRNYLERRIHDMILRNKLHKLSKKKN